MNSEEDTEKFLSYAKEHNLITSCGSDSHGGEDDLKHGSLGSMEMDEEWLTKFLTKLKAQLIMNYELLNDELWNKLLKGV